MRTLIDPAKLAAYEAEERRVADQPDDEKREQGPASDWYTVVSPGTLALTLTLTLTTHPNPNPHPHPHPSPQVLVCPGGGADATRGQGQGRGK